MSLDAEQEEEGLEGVVRPEEEEEESGVEDDRESAQGDGVDGEEKEETFGGLYKVDEVNAEIFEELVLPDAVVDEVSIAWSAFLQAADSHACAGDALYAAIFDAAPALQSLFKTPRAVMGLRFVNCLSQISANLKDPQALKVITETLAFQHLDMEVTGPRIALFRSAIVELLQEEVGARFTKKASDGWCVVLNYVGGAMIHIRSKYADRLKVLASSWAQANKMSGGPAPREVELENEGSMSDEVPIAIIDGDKVNDNQNGHAGHETKARLATTRIRGALGLKQFRGKASSNSSSSSGGEGSFEGEVYGDLKNGVPRNFHDMFLFNAAVMGFTECGWMQEVLASFDSIVTGISNSHRLQEECDVLSLRIAKYRGPINLGDYKAVMLSSLRSLVKDWGSLHETSWAWLWENVERMLRSLLGKPVAQEVALSRCLGSLDPEILAAVRRDIFKQFFALAPAGQDHFKQSTTRLHFIADRVFSFSLEMYRDPKRMVDDLSALGLRHVGYGIPPELFSPFVTSCVNAMSLVANDDVAMEAFRWSLTLISRMLQRVITEGSTIVMQAINANSGKQLAKAVACAGRAERASWVLRVQVGTQSISPLVWAIESGSFDAAKAIMVDLLTIRADRDSYYYGMDALFQRHPDIIKRLCMDAPVLLPVLLDGLVWRSRTTQDGSRRVNYYVKHLLVDSEGAFSKATQWIVDFDDPNIACHPVVTWVSDVVWNRVVLRTFLLQRAWFMFNLIVFMFAQSVLHYLDCGAPPEVSEEDASSSRRLNSANSSPTLDETESGCTHGFEIRLAIIILRSFMYTFVLGEKLTYHIKRICRSLMQKETTKMWRISIPAYLSKWQERVSFCLMLSLLSMLFLEPTLHCAEWNPTELFDEHCPEGEALFPYYKPISTTASLLYFCLLSDLVVLSTRVSAFVLVCCRVASEVSLTLITIAFFVLAFACAMSSLHHSDAHFAGIPISALSLIRISFGMFSPSSFDDTMDSPSLFLAVLVFNLIVVIFMLSMLVAQLVCAYLDTYKDMVGFARLNRGKVVVETMPSVPHARFEDFVSSLRLHERIEFGEGDVGLAGGVQILEPASANLTTVDVIKRFGGSTSPQAQWPADEKTGADEMDGFGRLQKHIDKVLKRLTGKGTRGSSHADGSSIGVSGSMNSFDHSSSGPSSA